MRRRVREPSGFDTLRGGQYRHRRVVRGGSWNNDQGFARASARNRNNVDNRNNENGFRLVCSVPIRH